MFSSSILSVGEMNREQLVKEIQTLMESMSKPPRCLSGVSRMNDAELRRFCRELRIECAAGRR